MVIECSENQMKKMGWKQEKSHCEVLKLILVNLFFIKIIFLPLVILHIQFNLSQNWN